MMSRVKCSEYMKVLIEEAHRLPGDVGYSPSQIPTWLDKELFRRGQQLYFRYFFSLMVTMLSGLLGLMVIPNIVNVLSFTRKSSTSRTAFVRYFSTIRHVISWFQGDPWDTNSSSHSSILKVRVLHSQARKKTQQTPDLTVTQLEMVQTQWAFFGLGLMHPRRFGMSLTDEDAEGLIHFWRGIGYLMGIDDKYNLCSGDTEETLLRCIEIGKIYFKPGMLAPPAVAPSMSNALMNGMSNLVPVISLDPFKVHLGELLDLPRSSLPVLHGWDYFLRFLYVLVCEKMMLMKIFSFVRPLLNFLLWLTIMVWVRASHYSRLPNIFDFFSVTFATIRLTSSSS